MATFWPGIGKQQVKCFDRPFRQKITYGVRNLDIQNTDIFERGRFAAGFCDAAGYFINTEKIPLGTALR